MQFLFLQSCSLGAAIVLALTQCAHSAGPFGAPDDAPRVRVRIAKSAHHGTDRDGQNVDDSDANDNAAAQRGDGAGIKP